MPPSGRKRDGAGGTLQGVGVVVGRGLRGRRPGRGGPGKRGRSPGGWRRGAGGSAPGPGRRAGPALASGAEARGAGCTGQVVLDAGHGGSDSGAINARYGLGEKEQTLDVARRLETLLEAEGHAVCMTRTEDETLSNNDRYAYANTTGAEVLVSVHMNGSSDPATDYTTTLFGKWRKDKELAHAVFDGLSTLPAAYGAGTMRTRTPYSFASGALLTGEMPPTIAATVFITSEAARR